MTRDIDARADLFQGAAMKNLAFVLVAALPFAALGCKKGGAGGDCAAAINHSMELSKDMMVKMGTDDATMAKMKDVGIQHCKDDKWSDDAIKCMVDAKAMADAQACYGKLTQEQRDAMKNATKDLRPAAAGGSAAAAPATGNAGSAPEGSAAAGSGPAK